MAGIYTGTTIDANGNVLPTYTGSSTSDPRKSAGTGSNVQRGNGAGYSMGYDPSIFPFLQPEWLAKNDPKGLELLKSGNVGDLADNYQTVGMPGTTPAEQAALRNKITEGGDQYANFSDPNSLQRWAQSSDTAGTKLNKQQGLSYQTAAQGLLAKFGGDPNKAAAYASAQMVPASEYNRKGGFGASLTGFQLAAALLLAQPELGSMTGLGAYGVGDTAAGTLAGGTGAGTAIGGEATDTLGVEMPYAAATETTPGAISGGSGLTTVGGGSQPFSLSEYLGLNSNDTLLGKIAGGAKDIFSSPYGQAASTANTVHTALGDVSKSDAKALAAVAAASLPLIANSIAPGKSSDEGSAGGFNGFTNAQPLPPVAPQYRSIYSGFAANPNSSSADPYEKFFNASKRNFAEGGATSSINAGTQDVENSLFLKKAAGYNGAPDNASWNAWATDPTHQANYQNYMQSVRSVDPSAVDTVYGSAASTDPYARYGQGPEKLFFKGLDQPINATGQIINGAGTPQTGTDLKNTDLNQAAKKAAGYTGGFDNANDFYSWAVSNPDNFVNYLQNINTTNPGFTPGFVGGNSLDWNPNVSGNQNFGPVLNQALGRKIGYTGPVGSGQLGSGLENDYLIAHPEDVSIYESLRDIVDPTYKWSKNFAQGGQTAGTDMQDDDTGGGLVRGAGDGKSDDIPAMLADGEHVITAQEVSALGNGSNGAGQKRLYEFRKRLRAHSTQNKSGHSPKSKDIASYLRGL